jgi:alcohol dehydrogenase, propanol-preferring
LALAAQVAKPKGAVAIVGLAGGTLPVAFGQLPLECSVAIPYWGSRSELMEVIALAQAGRIHPQVERFPLEQAPVAYQRMRDGQLQGRAVITPSAG